MENGRGCSPILNKQREASLGQLRWSDTGSLEFGEQRTDRRGSEWTERQGRAAAQQKCANVSYGPTNRPEGGRAPESAGERLCPEPEFPDLGITESPGDPQMWEKGKHWISTKPHKQDHSSYRSLFLISSPSPIIPERVRMSSFWVGEELVRKNKPTIKSSLSAGFQAQRSTKLEWREMLPGDEYLKVSLLHWAGQLSHGHETTAVI